MGYLYNSARSLIKDIKVAGKGSIHPVPNADGSAHIDGELTTNYARFDKVCEIAFVLDSVQHVSP